jgi:hypothetical protein
MITSHPKKSLVIVLCLLINLTIISQEFIPGFKLGLNNTTYKTNFLDVKSKQNLTAGVTLTALLNDKMDLISEYTYSKRGGSVLSDDISSPLDLSFHAFDFSLILNYYLKAPNISLQAGPIFGIHRSTPSDLSTLVSNSTLTLTDELNNDELFYVQESINNSFSLQKTKSIDFALAFGISGGTEELRFNLRYIAGLSNYYKSSEFVGSYDFDKDFTIKNNILQLSIIYNLTMLRIIRN